MRQPMSCLYYVPGERIDLSFHSIQVFAHTCGFRTDWSMLCCSILHLKRPQAKYTEAIPLVERALSIKTEKLGENHPDTVATRNALECAQEKVRAQPRCLVGKAS